MPSSNKIFDEDIPLTKARELIDLFLDPENIFAPKNIFDVSEKFISGYIYRGQANKDWPLLPAAHREGEPLKRFTPQPPYKGYLDDRDINLYLLNHIHAELRAVKLFLEAADHIGIITPLDYSYISAHDSLLDELRADKFSDKSLDFPLPPYISSVALAQHYGVPTRLLDWTESPLIAAYFAAEQASALEKNGRKNCDFSVICLNTDFLETVKSISSVPTPRANNPFLRAQRGTFTIINNATQYFQNNEKWPSMEDIVKIERPTHTHFSKYPLIRISLPASEADDLLRLLYRLDISKLTLMPSLHNAAKNFAYKQVLWPKVDPAVKTIID